MTAGTQKVGTRGVTVPNVIDRFENFVKKQTNKQKYPTCTFNYFTVFLSSVILGYGEIYEFNIKNLAGA